MGKLGSRSLFGKPLASTAISTPYPHEQPPHEHHSWQRTAYEALLADCCHYDGILSVLMQHRPYFEALPSVRRPENSVVAIPLPNVRSREVSNTSGIIDTHYHIRQLPCDVALMMCDPEWKIKTGIEIVLFIQRPGEDLSDLLNRWRQTQIELGQGVEWLMPRKHKHLLAEGTETPHPLFVVLADERGELDAAGERTVRGLTGASFPVVTWTTAAKNTLIQTPDTDISDTTPESL